MGARTITPFNGGGDWIATKPAHWIFEGTGMKQGDSIPGLVGWEFHGDPADIPGLEVVAEGIALSGGVRPAQGACPADHPVKGRLDLVPPRREYWAPGSTGYEQAMATICFVTEADAQKALYRQAAP